ncbi:MAG: efflux transporter periplasmic adaptor subunit [Lutibacter sp.]|nr:MAG: efflux transporter periplasmic adaptor subunit [Lutibacter sp.]
MRKLISILFGLVLIAGAIFITKKNIDNKKKPKIQVVKIVKIVFTDVVENKEVPIVITTSGTLIAKNKIELFAEVQGVLRSSSKEFKSGTSYRKGEAILRINNDEFFANLQSQKSSFSNNIIAIMPDIRLDYPSEFDKWNVYLKSIDVNKSIPQLPIFNSDKEKYFISGRGINTAYYNVKNLEVKLNKYNLYAPFDGVVTEALVTQGTLVRVGQKLGELINPSVYEMEVSINSEFANLLKKGNVVELHNLEKTKKYSGKVIRINGRVDVNSQTIKAYIQVAHEDLKEGMYLEADLVAKSEKNAFEISRKLLIENKQIFVVNDTILNLIDVNPVYFSADKVIIKDLKDGTLIVSKPVVGGYDGMAVKVFKEQQED